VDKAQAAPLGDPSRYRRPAREDDPDGESAGDEIDRGVVSSKSRDRVDVDRCRRAVRSDAMDERRQVRIADEDAGVEAGRRMDAMPAVARE
jgi:hypothetical protein